MLPWTLGKRDGHFFTVFSLMTVTNMYMQKLDELDNLIKRPINSQTDKRPQKSVESDSKKMSSIVDSKTL